MCEYAKVCCEYENVGLCEYEKVVTRESSVREYVNIRITEYVNV